MTTVEEFLRPPHGPEELDHVLVKISEDVRKKHDSDDTSENSQKHDLDNASESSQKHDLDNSRFAPLAEHIHDWSEFDIQKISSDPLIAPCLSRPCEVRWEPQVPKFARVIYCERQLEALYLQTLITRVNIALDKAIPPEEERIAIIVGPGGFESVSAEGSVNRLLPDWIVVQGTFDTKVEGISLPIPNALAAKRRILAVGDTKLVRQGGSEVKAPFPHTRACQKNFLRQLQHYCVNLYTRFGFILSNEELVVAQFECEQEAIPRTADERGLRSKGVQQLAPGLDDEASQRPDSPSSLDQDHDSPQLPVIDNPYPPVLLKRLVRIPSKRPHSSISPETSPVAATSASRRNRYDSRSLSASDAGINSGFHQTSSDPLAQEPASSSQDHSKYAPSVRDVEVGAIRVRSFDMLAWGEESESFDKMVWEGESSPYRALFMLVMMVRARRLRGEPIHVE